MISWKTNENQFKINLKFVENWLKINRKII